MKALANATAEIVLLRQLLKELQLPSPVGTQILWCDNVSAISLASNHVFHARTKHVEVDFSFVREKGISQTIAYTLCAF